tara:strand:+ start:3926 stop:4147 length:222 start_codon:yes stop_codon:yes gene_type:complete
MPSIYRFKGGGKTDIEVMSDKSYKTLQKVKKDSVVSFEAKLSKSHIRLMEKAIGKHKSNAELLTEFLKQVSQL